MIALKSKENLSWSELSKMSDLPEATIRKIFSGETADPRFETVAKLVLAMGGSIDEMLGNAPETAESESTPLAMMREIYESRIAEIKKSSQAHIESLKRDKRYLGIVCAVLGIFIIGWLIIDLSLGSVGWFRY